MPAARKPPSGGAMAGHLLTRVLGGPPAVVLLRLVFASLVVGAILIWFDIQPSEVFAAVQRLAIGIWGMGFDAIREAAKYVLVGAIVVIPVWLISRLLGLRRSP
jgi:hypothetical protein